MRLNRYTGHLSAGLHLLGMGVRLLFMLSLARLSTPEVMGQYGLASALEVVVIYLAGLEYHTFTSRRYARGPHPGRLRVLMKCHWQVLLGTVPLALVTGYLLTQVFSFSRDPLVIASLLTVIACGMVSQETNRILILTRRPVHSAAATFLRNAAWQPCILPVLSPGSDGIRLIFLAWGLFAFISMAWTLWLLRAVLWSRGQVRMSYLRAGLWAARHNYVIAALNVLRANQERFILQLLLGPAAVGVFTFFQTIANTLPSLMQAGVMNLMLPNLLERFSRHSKDRCDYLDAQLRRAYKLSCLLALALTGLGVPLTYALKRSEYLAFLWLLPALLLGHVLVTATQPIHLALFAAHRDRLLLWISSGTLLASVVLSIVSIQSIGLAGAALAFVLVAFSIAAIRHQALKQLAQD